MTNTLENIREQEAAERAFAVHLRIVQAMADGQAALSDAAEALAEFGGFSGWHGRGCKTIGDWLAAPEISSSIEATKHAFAEFVSATEPIKTSR